LTASRCSFARNVGQYEGAIFSDAVVTRLSDCTFTGNSCLAGDQAHAGAVNTAGLVTHISNCAFTGNSGGPSQPGAIRCNGVTLRLLNCTFADNRGRPNTLQFWPHVLLSYSGSEPVAELTQCIVWDGPEPFSEVPHHPSNILVAYSDVQGGYAGQGNMDMDPRFVQAGYWADPADPSIEVGPDDPDAVWVAGDYHLKSQAGHWDREAETWIPDDVTSPCIDAGNPNGFLGAEPFPNGGFVNLGAYGGTLEASRSYFGAPVCENQLAGDINGDCRVDLADIDILLSHWLMDTVVPANIPPVVSVVSPEDGAEISAPTPLVFRADASDADGTVVQVRYHVEYRSDGSMLGVEMSSVLSADGWESTLRWSSVQHDGTYTVWAEAMDNEGATTISPEITVTLHPSN
jgi:hypothetical protein